MKLKKNIVNSKRSTRASTLRENLNLLSCKRSQEGGVSFFTVGVIISILVLISAIIFLAQPKIIEWIKNLPGNSAPKDTSTELSADVARSLGYLQVGFVKFEKGTLGLGGKYRVYWINRINYVQSECNSPNIWNEPTATLQVFYDDYGILSKERCDKTFFCKSGSVCTDSTGRLLIHKTLKDTSINLDWNLMDNSEGKVIFIRPGITRFNQDIGIVKNNFILIDFNVYNSYKSEFDKAGITETAMKYINGSKYIGGGDSGLYHTKVGLEAYSIPKLGDPWMIL